MSMLEHTAARRGSSVSTTRSALDEFAPEGTREAAADPRFDMLQRSRRIVERGQGLFLAGDVLKELHVVRTGLFKSRLALAAGREQVIDFHRPGEMLGLDAIGQGTHRSDAIAVVDSEVGAIDFAAATAPGRHACDVQQWLCRLMSQRIARLQATTAMLGQMRADERVATFVLHTTGRQGLSGATHDTIVLPMTRLELGSHLGLTLETVSRCLSRLRAQGIVDVRQRKLRILDWDALVNMSRGQ